MIGIIDYGCGNIFSVHKALNQLGAQILVIQNPEEISKAKKLILPGVGHAGEAMKRLSSLNLLGPLAHAVNEEKKNVLGICLGFEIMTQKSEEGPTECLGWFETDTKKFSEVGGSLKIPHMGWNSVSFEGDHPLFNGLGQEDEFYFAHSYYVSSNNFPFSSGKTIYGNEFTSVLANGHIMGVQFHPEKSHESGMKLLKNFLTL